MKNTSIEIENKVDELMEVLDNYIEYIKENISRLKQLRILVIKRDDTLLRRLLESIQSDSGTQKKSESMQQILRKQLAVMLRCDFEQMTLSKLECELSGLKKEQVSEKKKTIKNLSDEMKKEHLSTTMLLSDCARFNSVLLKSILAFAQQDSITYSSHGTANRQGNAAFMNVQL